MVLGSTSSAGASAMLTDGSSSVGVPALNSTSLRVDMSTTSAGVVRREKPSGLKELPPAIIRGAADLVARCASNLVLTTLSTVSSLRDRHVLLRSTLQLAEYQLLRSSLVGCHPNASISRVIADPAQDHGLSSEGTGDRAQAGDVGGAQILAKRGRSCDEDAATGPPASCHSDLLLEIFTVSCP